MKREGGWFRFVVLVALAFGALVLTIISGPKPKQISELTLAPFYQKDAFLIAVIRLDSEQRSQDIELAKKLVAAKYAPVDDSVQFAPFDIVVGMEKSGIAVIPGSFFCRDGRYAETDMPIFQAKNPDEAFKFIEAIAGAQQRICAPTVESSKRFI